MRGFKELHTMEQKKVNPAKTTLTQARVDNGQVTMLLSV